MTSTHSKKKRITQTAKALSDFSQKIHRYPTCNGLQIAELIIVARISWSALKNHAPAKMSEAPGSFNLTIRSSPLSPHS